jgi:hypothetical protein
MPSIRYDPVGRCIYCGSTNYAPGSNRFLGDEHIIAEAISGEMILPEASCRACERSMNRWETGLLKGALLGCKTHLGLQTKRPQQRPKALPLFDPREERKIDGRERRVMVPMADYPVSLLLAKFEGPRLFNAEPYDILLDSGCLHFFTIPNWPVLLMKYDLPRFASSSLDTFALCRTLAKIAHAYAIATFGMDNFIPVLPHFIMGNYDEYRVHYVGGHLDDEPPSSSLHEISIEEPTEEQWQYIVVRIRLFAIYGSPVYRVVAGRRLNPKKPLAILLEEANESRRTDRMTFANQPCSPIPEGLWDPSAPSYGEAPRPALRRFVRVVTGPNPPYQGS